MTFSLCTLAVWSTGAHVAEAKDSTKAKPAVLILDSSLGDLPYYRNNWLSADVKVLVSSGEYSLQQDKNPKWWGGENAPVTFLLASETNAPIAHEQLLWALDQIYKVMPESGVFLIAQGATGLHARAYIEDMIDPLQSSRADVVGLVMMSTPNQGIGNAEQFSNLDLWNNFVSGAALEIGDVLPLSDYIGTLNQGRFPNVVRTLVLDGVVTDLGFGGTDGVLTSNDVQLPDSISSSVTKVVVPASATQGMNLSAQWARGVQPGSPYKRILDQKAINSIGLESAWSTSSDAMAAIREYYKQWYSDGGPNTHLSTIMAIDVSGSMAEHLPSGQTKLQSAQAATKDFLISMQSRARLDYSIPEDISILAFNTKSVIKSSGNVREAMGQIGALRAAGNTDIGNALASAVNQALDSPRCADKRIILLSDGLNTVGLGTKKILSGPVEKAKKAGVRIDTIAFGSFKQKDSAFLKDVSARTGGKHYNPKSQFELRRDFLKARYTTLGVQLADKTWNIKKRKSVVLGTVEQNTTVLEVGIVFEDKAPKATLYCGGKPVDPKLINVSTQRGGLAVLVVKQPQAGQYSIQVSDQKPSAGAHVYAVVQSDPFVSASTQVADSNIELIILGAIGLVAVLLVTTMVLISRHKKKTNSASDESLMITGGSDGIDEGSEGSI